MNPLLLPLILILYAEGSSCTVTRKVARVLLYSSLLSLLTTSYMPSLLLAKLSLMFIHIIGFLCCIQYCQKIAGKLTFLILLLGVFWIDLSILIGSLKYDITLLGYSLLTYSNYFYREMILVSVGLCASIGNMSKRDAGKENTLGLVVASFWILDKFTW
jgi:hypothetical protein